MKGFDDEFVDIVDYIVRITHRIWEEKGIGRIYDYYSHNCAVHTAYGSSYDREDVIAGTQKTLSAFPDRRLYADDVIWSGNDKDGYHTSHRITSIGHNSGYSAYGAPTGRKVVWRAIANCFVKENRVVEEWLVRDELNLVQQLGFDGREVAAKLARQETKNDIPRHAHGEISAMRGSISPEALPSQPSGEFDIEDFVRRNYHDIWNRRLLDSIRANYVETHICHTVSGREFYGADEYTAYVLSLLGMFPDAKMTVDHIYWIANAADRYRVAVRWSLVGMHSGAGVYGEPTGKRVNIMGISHHHVQGGKFVAEWTVFDEIALLKQLYTLDKDGEDHDASKQD